MDVNPLNSLLPIHRIWRVSYSCYSPGDATHLVATPRSSPWMVGWRLPFLLKCPPFLLILFSGHSLFVREGNSLQLGINELKSQTTTWGGAKTLKKYWDKLPTSIADRRISEPSTVAPIGSMYGIFTYIWLIFMVNVGKYTIHGSYGASPRTINDTTCLDSTCNEAYLSQPYRPRLSCLAISRGVLPRSLGGGSNYCH